MGIFRAGIQGSANTTTNQIFLNRANLSLEENKIVNEPLPQYRQGVVAFQQRAEALQAARSTDDELWRETIWHEVAHIHDAYLGFADKSLSEMSDTPFGAPPWPTKHARDNGTPKEDFAESYSVLLRLRRGVFASERGEADFIADAVEHPQLGEKYRFILENCWGYNVHKNEEGR